MKQRYICPNCQFAGKTECDCLQEIKDRASKKICTPWKLGTSGAIVGCNGQIIAQMGDGSVNSFWDAPTGKCIAHLPDDIAWLTDTVNNLVGQRDDLLAALKCCVIDAKQKLTKAERLQRIKTAEAVIDRFAD